MIIFFFKNSATPFLCSAVRSETNTGTEVEIAVGIIFVTSSPPVLQGICREACQLKDY